MAWEGSDRRKHLPSNWPALREQAHILNPRHLCHMCGRPGGEALDHKNGNRDDHRQENLDWVHDWRSVRAGASPVNCHQIKTRHDRPSLWRPKEQHPAL